MERLIQQLAFIVEIDKLKSIVRQSYLMNGSRKENDAEHTWHLAMMALLLAEHANERVDVNRVIQMLLVHDLVEIDAGDTFAYDDRGHDDKEERERRAADRIFSLLPHDQATALRALWDEFEERATPEARFAAAVDRFHPMLHNYHNQGKSWQEHGITSDRVLIRNQHIAEGSATLWEYVRLMIQDAVGRGYLKEK
ncbi:MAG: HD domain-containing protein [Bacillota bacterium]